MKAKLSLFKIHAGRQLSAFKFTRDLRGEDEAYIGDADQVPVGVLDSLQTTFSGRFADFAGWMMFAASVHVRLPHSAVFYCFNIN